MIRLDLLPVIFAGAAAVLAALVALRADVARARAGRVVAFMALFVFPALAVWGGFSTQMEHAQTTKFCLSCHVMTDFGRTLLIDDPSYLPAVHFQNNRVPRDKACYTCHTDYSMFGGVRAKIRGMRHIYVQYFGTIPAPAEIQLYGAYNNRECLHCHDGAREFEALSSHNRSPETLGQIKSGQLSCLSSRCHDIVHDVETLPDVTFWKDSL
jgi:cytochrome c-type protein NapC